MEASAGFFLGLCFPFLQKPVSCSLLKKRKVQGTEHSGRKCQPHRCRLMALEGVLTDPKRLCSNSCKSHHPSWEQIRAPTPSIPPSKRRLLPKKSIREAAPCCARAMGWVRVAPSERQCAPVPQPSLRQATRAAAQLTSSAKEEALSPETRCIKHDGTVI